jgi:hypothetical protein
LQELCVARTSDKANITANTAAKSHAASAVFCHLFFDEIFSSMVVLGMAAIKYGAL